MSEYTLPAKFRDAPEATGFFSFQNHLAVSHDWNVRINGMVKLYKDVAEGKVGRYAYASISGDRATAVLWLPKGTLLKPDHRKKWFSEFIAVTEVHEFDGKTAPV